MPEPEWVDRLPHRGGGELRDYDATVARLDERPGQWGIVARSSSRGTIHQAKLRIKRRNPGYEFASRTVDGECRLYGRKIVDGGE